MNELPFYNAKEIYAETYYQLPKVFFSNNKYKKLSSDSKIAYALLKDRFNYSLRNNWCDEHDHIYFIYTVKELTEILNCGTEKVSKIKKELEKADLLFQKRIGLNRPNRLYLLKPIAEATDVYLQSKIVENKGVSEIEIPENSTLHPDTSGISEIEIPENSTLHLDTSGISEIENNQYKTNILDTNRHLIDTDKAELQNQILLDNFVASCHTSQVPTFIPDKVLQLIATFSPSYEVARQTVKTIHNAKYKAQEQTGITIIFEELEQQGIAAEAELYQTLLKAYQKNKTEKVKDIQSLIFVYVRNWFVEKPIALIQQVQSDESLPDVSIDSWL